MLDTITNPFHSIPLDPIARRAAATLHSALCRDIGTIDRGTWSGLQRMSFGLQPVATVHLCWMRTPGGPPPGATANGGFYDVISSARYGRLLKPPTPIATTPVDALVPTPSRRRLAQTLHVFDFDNTLFETVGPVEGPELLRKLSGVVGEASVLTTARGRCAGGWLARPESLQSPIPVRPGPALEAMKASCATPGVAVLVLTGRRSVVAPQLRRLLEAHGVAFDSDARVMLHMREPTDPGSLDFKMARLRALLARQYHGVTSVRVWDDDPATVCAYKALSQSLEVQMTVIDAAALPRAPIKTLGLSESEAFAKQLVRPLSSGRAEESDLLLLADCWTQALGLPVPVESRLRLLLPFGSQPLGRLGSDLDLCMLAPASCGVSASLLLEKLQTVFHAASISCTYFAPSRRCPRLGVCLHSSTPPNGVKGDLHQHVDTPAHVDCVVALVDDATFAAHLQQANGFNQELTGGGDAMTGTLDTDATMAREMPEVADVGTPSRPFPLAAINELISLDAISTLIQGATNEPSRAALQGPLAFCRLRSQLDRAHVPTWKALAVLEVLHMALSAQSGVAVGAEMHGVRTFKLLELIGRAAESLATASTPVALSGTEDVKRGDSANTDQAQTEKFAAKDDDATSADAILQRVLAIGVQMSWTEWVAFCPTTLVPQPLLRRTVNAFQAIARALSGGVSERALWSLLERAQFPPSGSVVVQLSARGGDPVTQYRLDQRLRARVGVVVRDLLTAKVDVVPDSSASSSSVVRLAVRATEQVRSHVERIVRPLRDELIELAGGDPCAASIEWMRYARASAV